MTSKPFCSVSVTVNIHSAFCSDAASAEKNAGRVLSEYYKRRICGSKAPINLPFGTFDAEKGSSV